MLILILKWCMVEIYGVVGNFWGIKLRKFFLKVMWYFNDLDILLIQM